MPLIFNQTVTKRKSINPVHALFCPYVSSNFHTGYSIRYFTQKRENRPHQGRKPPLIWGGRDAFPCLVPITFRVNYLSKLRNVISANSRRCLREQAVRRQSKITRRDHVYLTLRKEHAEQRYKACPAISSLGYHDDLFHGINFLEAVLLHPSKRGTGITDGVRHGVHRVPQQGT